MSGLIHIRVYLTGRCTKCKRYNELQVYDYGLLTYAQQDAAMDHVSHTVIPIPCDNCGVEYPAEHIVYRDLVHKEDVIKKAISHDYIDPDTSKRMLAGHEKRYEIFAEREEEFWAAFTDYALDNWQSATVELSKQEIAAGFRALGQSPVLRSDSHARREASKIHVTHRRQFWQAANAEFVNELVEIGAMGWTLDEYVKMFGAGRTRFGIMYLPIADALEDLRTKYIGALFKKEKGDNAFLLRRIGQLTDAAHKQTVKYNKALRQIDEQKHIIADLQDKLGQANARIADLSHQQPAQDRNSDDVRRIRELKSFVGELLAELRALRPDEPSDAPDAPVLDEDVSDDEPTIDMSVLGGKTVAIIGGLRRREGDGYPCRIVAHDGRKHDPEFYAALQADIIVVLTRYVSHASMWEARAAAIQGGKTIYYAQEINIARILNSVSGLNF